MLPLRVNKTRNEVKSLTLLMKWSDFGIDFTKFLVFEIKSPVNSELFCPPQFWLIFCILTHF